VKRLARQRASFSSVSNFLVTPAPKIRHTDSAGGSLLFLHRPASRYHVKDTTRLKTAYARCSRHIGAVPARFLDRRTKWERELSEEKASFEEALTEFRGLLGRSRYSGEIVWVMPDDVLLTGRRIVYVRVPPAEENFAIARQTYEKGMARGSGVLFTTVCEMDSVVCCCAWSPERFEDGHQGLWTRGLKMSVKIEESRIPGKAVRSALWWRWLGWRHRKKQSLKEFMMH
jgi:hypothetical protein